MNSQQIKLIGSPTYITLSCKSGAIYSQESPGISHILEHCIVDTFNSLNSVKYCNVYAHTDFNEIAITFMGPNSQVAIECVNKFSKHINKLSISNNTLTAAISTVKLELEQRPDKYINENFQLVSKVMASKNLIDGDPEQYSTDITFEIISEEFERFKSSLISINTISSDDININDLEFSESREKAISISNKKLNELKFTDSSVSFCNSQYSSTTENYLALTAIMSSICNYSLYNNLYSKGLCYELDSNVTSINKQFLVATIFGMTTSNIRDDFNRYINSKEFEEDISEKVEAMFKYRNVLMDGSSDCEDLLKISRDLGVDYLSLLKARNNLNMDNIIRTAKDIFLGH